MSTFPLFNKKAEIDIDGKVFSSDNGFTIEVEAQQKLGVFTVGKIRLYNPNDDTIGRCKQKKQGKKTVFPPCQAKCGYEGNFGVCLDGFIKKFDVFQEGRNRILEMTIGDTENWIYRVVNKTYKDMKASEIIKDIVGDNPSRIDLGQDVKIKRLYVRTVVSGIENYLHKATQSSFAFRNGILTMEPRTKFANKEILLNYNNGLAGIPEKINVPKRGVNTAFSGWKIKTLFLYGINLFTSVRIQTSPVDPNKQALDVKGKVERMTQKFSTFRSLDNEYEIRPAS